MTRETFFRTGKRDRDREIITTKTERGSIQAAKELNSIETRKNVKEDRATNHSNER